MDPQITNTNDSVPPGVIDSATGTDPHTTNGSNGSNGSNGTQSMTLPVATIGDSAVTISGLVIQDRETVEFVRDRVEAPDLLASDLASAVQIGVRAIRTTDGVLDARTVEERFAGLSSDIARSVADLVRGVTEQAEAAGGEFQAVAEGLLDKEDGSFIAAMQTARTEFVSSIDGMFDPTSTESILAKFENVLEKAQKEHEDEIEAAHARHQVALAALIDPNAEDGPISRLNTQVTSVVKAGTASIEEKLMQIIAQVSAEQAADDKEREMKEVSTQKGVEFEDLVQGAVEDLIVQLGDVVRPTGTERGIDGGKKGDFVVDINPESTGSAEVAYVIEAKDRELGRTETRREMEAAMSNRGAKAAVIVFAKQSQSPMRNTPFGFQGNMAWVVYDKETGDDAALRVALMWARWVCIRELRDAGGSVNAARVADLIATATEALAAASNIRRSHTTAKTQLQRSMDDADRHLTSMVDKIGDALEEIEGEIDLADKPDEASDF